MEEQWWYAMAVANDVMIVKHSFRSSITQVLNRTGSELAGADIYSGR